MKTGAAFARGASKQDYSTPVDFIAAVEKRFGKIDFDLAANAGNAKAARYFSETDDALAQDWDALARSFYACTTDHLHLFLNPPFGNIAPWARKCAESRNARPLSFLIPAAVGSNWYREFVHERAKVYILNGRLSFDGKSPYPKDCLLARYGEPPGYYCWTWPE